MTANDPVTHHLQTMSTQPESSTDISSRPSAPATVTGSLPSHSVNSDSVDADVLMKTAFGKALAHSEPTGEWYNRWVSVVKLSGNHVLICDFTERSYGS